MAGSGKVVAPNPGVFVSDYYRGDRRSGITGPDLSKNVEYADHIVRARGKRTQFTSVSLSKDRIRDFGEQLYKFKQDEASHGGHSLVEHDALMNHLRAQAASQEKADKLKAVQALRYAKQRQEGLVNWSFDIDRIERKNLINWTETQIQPFFEKE